MEKNIQNHELNKYENFKNLKSNFEYLVGYINCSLFKDYWCGRKNNRFTKILKIKEKIISESISIENISKITFDVKLLKSLILNKELENKFENIYQLLLIDNHQINEIRNFVYFRNAKDFHNFDLNTKLNSLSFWLKIYIKLKYNIQISINVKLIDFERYFFKI